MLAVYTSRRTEQPQLIARPRQLSSPGSHTSTETSEFAIRDLAPERNPVRNGGFAALRTCGQAGSRSLTEEKTGVHLFTRFRKRDSKRFNFLGFEYRWGRSLKGSEVVKLRTSPKKMHQSLATFTEWLKERRNKRLKTIFWELNPKLLGYYNYYGWSGRGSPGDDTTSRECC